MINLIVIRLLKCNYANKSTAMMKNNNDIIHIGGWLTIWSKHMFIKDKKKNALKSRNTIPQRIVRIGVELY